MVPGSWCKAHGLSSWRQAPADDFLVLIGIERPLSRILCSSWGSRSPQPPGAAILALWLSVSHPCRSRPEVASYSNLTSSAFTRRLLNGRLEAVAEDDP